MKVKCRNCENGIWYAECCNGANGCDCGGQPIAMGTCKVCGGTGYHEVGADTMANAKTIRGMCFLGSGPTSGYWARK